MDLVPPLAVPMQLARWTHLLGVVVWIGGMFFAHMAQRPAVQALPPPQRLPLLEATLGRFLAWAAGAIVGIVVSGVALVAMLGGWSDVGTVDLGLGLLTITVAVFGR